MQHLRRSQQRSWLHKPLKQGLLHVAWPRCDCLLLLPSQPLPLVPDACIHYSTQLGGLAVAQTSSPSC